MPPDDERLIELVNLAVDGEATAAEREELDSLLRHSGPARDTEEALRRTVARLEAAPLAEPPADLRQTVMAAVSRTPAPVSRLEGRRRRFAFAWAAAAAALVAAFFLLQAPPVERRDTRAVMAPGRLAAARIVVKSSADGYVLEPVVPGARPVSGKLSWSASDGKLIAISGGEGASFSENQVAFTLRGPADRVVVVIRPVRNEPFAVRLSVEGDEIQQTVGTPE